MNQSRLSSLIEAGFNVVIGLGISLTANALILPQFGFAVTASQNLTIGVLYTIISLVRSYVIRRWFNARLHRTADTLAKRIT